MELSFVPRNRDASRYERGSNGWCQVEQGWGGSEQDVEGGALVLVWEGFRREETVLRSPEGVRGDFTGVQVAETEPWGPSKVQDHKFPGPQPGSEADERGRSLCWARSSPYSW